MLLLEKVFQIINNSGLVYCIQNKYEMMPETIPSDIDMMYKDASEDFLDNLVKRIATETGLIITQKICQGYFEYTYIISYPCPKEKNFHLVDVNRDLDAIVDDITRTILKETARKTARIMK